MRKILIVFTMLLLSWQVLAKSSQVIVGKVDEVLTADIATVLTERGKIYVRLAGVDAPDLQQPYGDEAQQCLVDLIDDKEVVLRQLGVDNCGRMVAMMWINGSNDLDISSQMIKSGAAWVYRRYADSEFLVDLENQARTAQVGLWALPPNQRTAPWEWRKKARFMGKQPADECYVAPKNNAFYH
jgi:endonuclease YncB( thermonuclease family)